MRKVFCDRCGEEMKVPYINVWIGWRDRDAMEMCEKCCDALYRFMGMNTPGGGYEKLDSEMGGEAREE